MPAYLALDQSTSATKAILFDRTGQVIDRASLEHEQIYPRPGWVEHDAEAIWQNTLAVLREVLGRNTGQIPGLACLSITNQRETVVVFSRETGKPLGHAMVWQCRRGVPICGEHQQAGREAMVREKTGLKLDAYFSASKLQHLVRSNADLAAKLASGEALIGTIDTYLIYRLTRGEHFVTDHTNASRTLLFDIRTLGWDQELCDLWEVPMQSLAEPRNSTATFGSTDLEGLLKAAIPITGVMGDSHASLFAHRCFQPGMSKVTFGTGSSVMMNIGTEMKLSDKGVVTTLAWVHDNQPVYAFEGIVISSAATLSWLRTQLGLISDFAETEKLAREIEDSDGVYFVPAFSGLGLPYWEPSARAAIVGLSGHSDRRHIVRAGLEAIAYQLKEALEAMRQDADIPLQSLHGDGGPTSNQFLMQFTCDMAGIDLRIATMSECSPLGATLAGMIGLRHCRDTGEVAAIPRQEVTYHPRMPAERVTRLFAGWQRAVRQVLQQ